MNTRRSPGAVLMAGLQNNPPLLKKKAAEKAAPLPTVFEVEQVGAKRKDAAEGSIAVTAKTCKTKGTASRNETYELARMGEDTATPLFGKSNYGKGPSFLAHANSSEDEYLARIEWLEKQIEDLNEEREKEKEWRDDVDKFIRDFLRAQASPAVAVASRHNKNLWTIPAVVASMYRKTKSYLDSAKNIKTLTDKTVDFTPSKYTYTACLHCLLAGRPPAVTIMRDRGASFKQHRKPQGKGKAEASCIRPQKSDNQSIRSRYGQDYINFTMPFYRKKFTFRTLVDVSAWQRKLIELKKASRANDTPEEKAAKKAAYDAHMAGKSGPLDWRDPNFEANNVCNSEDAPEDVHVWLMDKWRSYQVENGMRITCDNAAQDDGYFEDGPDEEDGDDDESSAISDGDRSEDY